MNTNTYKSKYTHAWHIYHLPVCIFLGVIKMYIVAMMYWNHPRYGELIKRTTAIELFVGEILAESKSKETIMSFQERCLIYIHVNIYIYKNIYLYM